MSVERAASTEVVNIPDLIERVEEYHSRALVKTDRFEAMLVQLARGRTMDTQNAPAPLIVQGISGTVRFLVDGKEMDISAGDWMYSEASAPESVFAVEDSAFLLTVLFSS